MYPNNTLSVKCIFSDFLLGIVILEILIHKILSQSTDGKYIEIKDSVTTIVTTKANNNSIILSTPSSLVMYSPTLVKLAEYSIPSYDTTGALIQLSTGAFVLAEQSKFYILNKDDPSTIVNTITTDLGSTSKIVSIYPIKPTGTPDKGSFIIANINSNVGKIAIYQEDGILKYGPVEMENLTRSMIDCVALKDFIVCVYVYSLNSRLTIIYLFDLTLTNKKLRTSYDIGVNNNSTSRIEPYDQVDTIGSRIIQQSDDSFIVTILKADGKLCSSTAQITDINTVYKTSHLNGTFDVLYWCERLIEYVHIAKIDESTFAPVCRDYTLPYTFLFAKIKISSGLMEQIYKTKCLGDTSGTTLTYPRTFIVSDLAVGVFYLVNNQARERLIYYPNCIDYEVSSTELYANTRNTLSFDDKLLQSTSVNGEENPTSFKIRFSLKDVYDQSLTSPKILSNGVEVNEDNVYDLTNLEYITGSVGGIITYSFSFVYASADEAAKYCKLIFNVKACATGCYTCFDNGNATETNCTLCDVANNYFPLFNKTSQCVKKDSPPDGYYYNETNKDFEACFTSCATCTGYGERDSSNCVACATDYYPLFNDTTRCYKKDDTALDFFYYNEPNSTFDLCHEGCLKCSGPGSATNYQCTSCNQTDTDPNKQYFPTINGLNSDGICYNEDTKPHNYYKTSTDIYDLCKAGCYSCNTKDDTITNTQCLSCNNANSYYRLENETSAPFDCYLSTSPPNYFFYNGSDLFYKCDTGCLTCTRSGDKDPSKNNTNCDTCDNTNGYALVTGIEGLCYDASLKFDGYVYNSSSKTFVPCSKGCLTCSLLTDITLMKCEACDTSENYYSIPITTNEVECHLKTEEVEGYYFNSTNNIFEECYEGCLYCAGYGDVNTPNCKSLSCSTDFYPLMVQPTKCWNNDTAYPKGYYLANSKFVKCTSECSKCWHENTPTATNCDACNTNSGYYPLSNDTTQCVDNDSKPENSFFDSVNSQYQICFMSCGSCSELGTSIENAKCLTCFDDNGYHLIETDTGNRCIDDTIKDASYPNYYYSVAAKKYLKCSIECQTCEGSASMCKECNNAGEYYELASSSTSGSIKYCKGPEIKESGYYLDQTVFPYQYKKCYSSCALCDEGGDETDNKCTNCKTNYRWHPTLANQCVSICTYYFYVDPSNVYHCTPAKTCPQSYKYLKLDVGECVSICDVGRYIFEDQCLTDCPAGTEIKGTECKPLDICQKTQYTISSSSATMANNIDTYGKNYCLEYPHTNKHVNIIENKDNLYKVVIYKDEDCAKEFVEDLSTLDLAGCPTKLREEYHIPDDEPLTTLKMSIPRKGLPDQLSYAFFRSLTGERLDLKICEGEKIEVTVSMNNTKGVNITLAQELAEQGIDVYNSSDPFFNDVCIPYTSEDGTDVTLDDRRKNYYQNVSFCEAGCNYTGVNLNSQEANCTCEVKTNFLDDILDNPLTGDFLEMINDANFEVLTCGKQVFNISNIATNICGWIIFGIGCIEIFVTILYAKNGLLSIRIYLLQYMNVNPPKRNTGADSVDNDDNNTNQLEFSDEIKEVNEEDSNNVSNENNDKSGDERNESEEDEKDNTYLSNEDPSNKIHNKNQSLIKEQETSQQKEESPACFMKKNDKKPKKLMLLVVNHNAQNDGTESDEEYSVSNRNQINNRPSNQSTMVYSSNNPITYHTAKTHLHSNRSYNDFLPINEKKSEFKLNENKSLQESTSKNIKTEITDDDDDEGEYSDSDLNNLDLYDAIIYDKRPFCKFYWSQLQEKQSIINTFFVKDELEPYHIKVLCFLFGIALYFTLNALFYTESYISEQFNSGGSVNFLNLMKSELTRCLYSSMVGIVVSFFLSCISSSKMRIKSLIKREKNPDRFRQESIEIIRNLRKKIIIFLIVNFILMFLFWYYVSAFCFCYKNTQVSWLIGGLITWGITLVFPFILCLLIAIFRFLGLKYKMESAFKISACLSD